jgi:hypothetical protein
MRSYAIVALSLFLCAAAAPAARADVPDPPGTVRKQRLNDEQVLLTWRDNSSNEDGFRIYRRAVVEPDFQLRATVGPDVTQYFENVEKGTVYIYEVIAFNQDGESDDSNQCYVNRNPALVPNYFNVRLIALTVVRVSWQDRNSGESGFQIQRSHLNKPFKTIATVPRDTEQYDDYTLSAANTYTYRVRALGKAAICWDNSKYSVERTVTTKGGVKILQIEPRGRGKGTVTSDPPGISCGATDDHCTAEFPLAREVTLYAKPEKGSTFAGWVDVIRCADTLGPCTVNMGQDRVIGAAFKLKK